LIDGITAKPARLPRCSPLLQFLYLIYLLYFQLLTDTPTQRPLINPFAINSLRTLFIATGVYPSSGLQLPMPYSLSTIPFLFKYVRTLLHFFALFLRLPKTQLISFQAIPHSLQKTPGVRVGPRIPAFPDWLSSTASDKIASLPTPCRQMDRAIEESL